MKKIFIGIWIILLALAAFSLVRSPEEVDLGADSQLFLGGTVFRLAGSGVSSSATSINLASFTITQTGQEIQDSDLSDTFYVTIEPGNSSRQEFVSCTTVTQGAGTAATLSGCTRGLSPIAPYTASTTLQFSHAGGSALIISNPPQLYDQAAFKGNDETITGFWNFSGAIPTIDSNATTSTQATNKAYVDSVANAGAATSTETNGGIVELATAIEAASSTDGGANKPLVLQAKNASSSPDTTNTGPLVVVTNTARKIAQAFLDLTANFLWSGNHNFTGNTYIKNLNASSTNIINGVTYNFPASDGTASSTVLKNDGSGNLVWLGAGYDLATSSLSVFSYSASSASSTVFSLTVPANTIGTNNILKVEIPMRVTDIQTSQILFFEVDWGTTNTVCNLSATTRILRQGGSFIFYIAGNGSTGSQVVSISPHIGIDGLNEASCSGSTWAHNEVSVDSTSAQTLKLEVRGSGSSVEFTTGMTHIISVLRPYGVAW